MTLFDLTLKFPVKYTDIKKVERTLYLHFSIFDCGNKEKVQSMYQKNAMKNADLLLTGEEDKSPYVLIIDFNLIMHYYDHHYDHTLYCGNKRFCRHCLHSFSTEEILTILMIALKSVINMPKKEYVGFKNFEREKSPTMIYADFEIILESESNGKKNKDDSYTKNYQNHVA